MPVILVALGGAVGAAARYLLDGFIAERSPGPFPVSTLVINLSGSFLLGLLFALATERNVLPADIRGPVMIGFIGAYTTFSTFMLESWRLVEGGAVALALLNVAGSCVLGLVAVAAGLLIGRTIA